MGAGNPVNIKCFYQRCFSCSCAGLTCRRERMRELTQNRSRIFDDIKLAVKFIRGLYQSRIAKVRNVSDNTIQICDRIIINFII